MLLELLAKPLEYPILLRNYLYLKGFIKRCKFPYLKIISVGNLSVGGTGKTPTVLQLARIFHNRGFKVSILLRGYKRKTKGTHIVSDGRTTYLNVYEAGDEAFLYAKLLKDIPVVVSENRCDGAELIEKRFKPDVILLDDALQHLKIERDFDIVLLTPKDLKDRVLPFGKLREPPSVLMFKGDFCLLSKTEHCPLLEQFCKSLNKPFDYLRVIGYRLIENPESFSLSSAYVESLKENSESFRLLEGKTVGVVSALGDNRSFFETVKNLAVKYRFKPVEFLAFPDHYHYRNIALDKKLVWLTTFKDYYKLRENFDGTLMVVDRMVELPHSVIKRVFSLLGKRETEKT